MRFIKNSKRLTIIGVALVLAVSLSLFSFFSGDQARAAVSEKVWTGGGSDNKFSTGANWQGGVAPIYNDALRFIVTDDVNSISAVNDIADLYVNYITFSNQITTQGIVWGGYITITGSRLQVNQGLYANCEPDKNFRVNITADLKLTGMVTIDNAYAGNPYIALNTITVKDNDFAHKYFTVNNGVRLSISETYPGNTALNGGSFNLTDDTSASVGGVTASAGTFYGDGSATNVYADGTGTIAFYPYMWGMYPSYAEGYTGPSDYWGIYADTLNLASFNVGNSGTMSIPTLYSPDYYISQRLVVIGTDPHNLGTEAIDFPMFSISGSVDLSGCDLDIAEVYDVNPTSWQVGDVTKVIEKTSTGPITGTFNGLAEGSIIAIGNIEFRITYQGGDDNNDVWLTVVSTHPSVEKVWTGWGMDDNFSNGDNWVGGVAPENDDSLEFRTTDAMPTITAINDIPDLSVTGVGFINEVAEYTAGYRITISGSETLHVSNGIRANNDQSYEFKTDITAPLYIEDVVTVDNNEPGISRVRVNDVTAASGAHFETSNNTILTFDGVYAGDSVVSSGKLVVNTDGDIGRVDVSASAIFYGNGTTDQVYIHGGGTMTAKGNTSQITIEGEGLSIGDSGTIQLINKQPNTGTYLITVDGAVELSGGTLKLSNDNGSYSENDIVRVISNDGTDAITGTFNGLAQGATITSDGMVWQISYTGGDGNDVTLTATEDLTPATERVWTGAAVDDNFSTGANWQGGAAPQDGDSLEFRVTDAMPTITAVNNIIDLSVSGIGLINEVETNTDSYRVTISGSETLHVSNGIRANNDYDYAFKTNITTPLYLENSVILDNVDNGTSRIIVNDVTGAVAGHFVTDSNVILAMNSTYTGDSVVPAGSLVVYTAGNIGKVDVSASGTFSGNGTANQVYIHGGGTMTAKADTSQITIENGLSIGDSGTIRLIKKESDTYLISVIGAVELSGGTLSVSNDNGTYNLGDIVKIISNDEADDISGTFNNLAEGATITSNGMEFEISYKGGDGNDVILTVTKDLTPNSEKVWTGDGTDDNFSTGANWQGGAAPQDGDSLEFRVTDAMPTITAVNDILDLSVSGIGLINEVETSTTDYRVTISGSETLHVSNGIRANNNQNYEFKTDITAPLYIEDVVTVDNNEPGVSRVRVRSVTAASGAHFETSKNTTLVLNGAYAGDSVVPSGNLVVNTDGDIGRVDVSASGKFWGNGTTDQVYIHGGGTMTAKGNTSQITIEGEGLSIGDSGTIQLINKQPNTGTYLITVDGAVELSGGTLKLSNDNGSYSENDIVRVISNDGTDAITGTFNGLAQGATITSDGMVWQISYTGGDGNDVTLTATRELGAPIVIPEGDESGQDITINDGVTYIINGIRGNIIINLGGTFKGTGTVDDVTMNTGGEMNPGQSPGIINTGNLVYTGGTLNEEIGGTASGEFDQVNVTGTVDLGSSVTNLSIAHWNGFTPALNDNYIIINNDSTDAITGTFNSLAEGGTVEVDGYTYTISYAGGTDNNDVVLTVIGIPATPEPTPTPVPLAPDTGFFATKATPILSILGGLLAAAGLGLVSKKRFLKDEQR